MDFGCGVQTFGQCVPETVLKMYSYDPHFYPNQDFVKEGTFDAITFWDSLEHMKRLGIVPLLNGRYVFISTPIIDGVRDLLKWKHFRPDEHVWYFSEQALVKLFKKWGYALQSVDSFEVQCGRSDVLSYCFVILPGQIYAHT